MTRLDMLACRPTIVPPRRGATLTEVLMALLVMGLGITSVFTLFPMSVTRSIKSTTLTNATLASQSVREFVYANRTQLLRAPQRHASYPEKDPFLYRSYQATVNSTSTMPPADAAIPLPFNGTFVVDPYGGQAAFDYAADPGKFGELSPGSPTAAWGVLRVCNGLYTLGADGAAGQSGTDDGSYGVTDFTTATSTIPDPTEIFYPGTDDKAAVNLITAPDSWVTVYEDFPTAIAASMLDGLPELTFSGTPQFNSTASPNSRLLIQSADGTRSHTMRLHPSTPVTGANTVHLAAALPEGLQTLTEIGTVRLQNFERRYTWLLTVHVDEHGSTTSEIVVFFRRGFGESERAYNLDQTVLENPAAIKRKIIRVEDYPERPKNGQYVFCTWQENNRIIGGTPNSIRRGRWFRILAAEEVTANQGGPETDYDLILDRPWFGTTNARQPLIVFPSGVVSVFNL